MEIQKQHSLIIQNVRVNVFEVVGFVPAFGTGVYAIIVIPIMPGVSAGREITLESMEEIHGSKRGFEEFCRNVGESLDMMIMGCVLEGVGGSNIEDVVSVAFRLM